MPDKKRFVGPNEVFGAVIQEFKTPKGGEIIKVMYVGEKVPPEIMTVKTFEAVVSEVPHDYNWLRETRYKNLIKEIAEIALEYDVASCEVGYLTEEVKKKFNAAFDRATNFLWTGDDKQFVPGFPALSYRTLLEAEEVMKKIIPNVDDTEKPTGTDTK